MSTDTRLRFNKKALENVPRPQSGSRFTFHDCRASPKLTVALSLCRAAARRRHCNSYGICASRECDAAVAHHNLTSLTALGRSGSGSNSNS